MVQVRLPAQADGTPAKDKSPAWFVEVKNGTCYCKCSSFSTCGRLCGHIILTAQHIALQHASAVPSFDELPPIQRVKDMVCFVASTCLKYPNLLRHRVIRSSSPSDSEMVEQVAVSQLPTHSGAIAEEHELVETLEARIAVAERTPAVMAKSIAKSLSRITSQFHETLHELNGYRFQHGKKDEREMSDSYLRECLLRLFNDDSWKALLERAQMLGVPTQWKQQLGECCAFLLIIIVSQHVLCSFDLGIALTLRRCVICTSTAG